MRLQKNQIHHRKNTRFKDKTGVHLTLADTQTWWSFITSLKGFKIGLFNTKYSS